MYTYHDILMSRNDHIQRDSYHYMMCTNIYLHNGYQRSQYDMSYTHSTNLSLYNIFIYVLYNYYLTTDPFPFLD